MRRLSCLILMILLILILAAGCGRNQSKDNGNPVVSGSSIADQTDQNADKSLDTADTGQQANINNAGTTAANLSPSSQTDTSIAADETVSLIISKDFGGQTLVEKQVAIQKDWTVIDLLESTARITTKWDGSFVNSLEGLEADNGGILGNKRDWFYFVNGICADVGASGYDLKAGEVVWWDYHAWKNMGSTNSAVIGCYPEPFIHGYRGKVGPTTIISSADNLNLAGNLQKAIKNRGVASVNLAELNNNLLENRQVPTILIVTWNEVKQLAWLESFNKAYRKTGVSVHFTDQGLELLDYNGDVAQTINGSAGVIVASGSGLGDANPLWLLVGTDQQGLQQAVDLLVSNPQKIVKCYNAAVVSGELIRLPLQ